MVQAPDYGSYTSHNSHRHKQDTHVGRQNESQVTPRKNKPAEYHTPVKKNHFLQNTPDTPLETPEKQIEEVTEIGPTPQLNGRVLGVFELASLTPFRSPEKARSNPFSLSPSKVKTGSPLKRQLGDDSFPEIFPTNVTPKKQKIDAGYPSTPRNSDSSQELLMATPVYIHQKYSTVQIHDINPSEGALTRNITTRNSRRRSTRRISSPINLEYDECLDEDSIDFSPRKTRKSKRLSGLINEFKQYQENQRALSAENSMRSELSEDLESVQEDPESPPQDGNDGNILPEELSVKTHETNELNPLDHLGEDIGNMAEVDISGEPRAIFKKKGQKRTTKRHIFRPNVPEEEQEPVRPSGRPAKVQENFRRLKLKNSGYKTRPNYFKRR